MKFLSVAVAILFLVVALPALALAANNTTTEQNLTPVSISRNATISIPTPSNMTLAKIGSFENGTVYLSGGANATVRGDALAVDMGEAAWMEYRDVYLFYRLPPGFASVSFDYDLLAGEKSNVLLFDFMDTLPKIGVKKGGIPDTAVLGLGTWTNTHSWIKGMDSIGGLMTFPQGAHHAEVVSDNGMLFLKVDGNTTAYNFFSQEKYLVIHLMVGDEKSYLRGTVANLRYEGPPLDTGKPDDSGDTFDIVIPDFTLNGKDNGSAGGQLDLPGGKETTPGKANGESKPLAGFNIWLALAAAAGFFIAWAVVYVKYLKR
jgi:hypothetical protein